MAFLNADVDHFECLVRRKYLYNMDETKCGFEDGLAFGVASVPGVAVGFHVMLRNGAVIGRLPVSALAHKHEAPDWGIERLQLWDCPYGDLSVHRYRWLAGIQCDVRLGREWHRGEYMLTIDWCGSVAAEGAGETAAKCGHLIKLDNGLYCIQPNNRIRWYEASFVTRPFEDRPDYVTMNHIFKCERGSRRWQAEDTDKMFYEVEKGES